MTSCMTVELQALFESCECCATCHEIEDISTVNILLVNEVLNKKGGWDLDCGSKTLRETGSSSGA